MVVYLASDLLWGTRIKSTADSLGIPCRPVRTLDMLNARLAESNDHPIKGLILDLEAGETAYLLLARLKGPDASAPERAIPVLVFGPHVNAEGFARAAHAGADRCLARGAFHTNLPAILRELHDAP